MPATKFAQSETTTPSSGQQAIPSTSSGASPSSAQAENQEIPSPALDVSSAGSSQAVPPITPVVQNQPIVQAKLPKLTLPRFRGEITHWITFWDSYNSAVHNNPALSKVDKFNYLNSLLEGAAKRSIQGLTLSDANYDSAVEILEQRFGKPQQIISAHMEELLKLPSCSGTERLTSLRFVYDKVSVHVRGLSSLGVNSDQYGGLLIPVIMSKPR